MITPAIEEEVVRKTLHKNPPQGTHWSNRLMGSETGLNQSQVPRIWKVHGVKPPRVEFFNLSKDPHFVEKLRKLVDQYVAHPEPAIVFSFDETSQIHSSTLGNHQASPMPGPARASSERKR